MPALARPAARLVRSRTVVDEPLVGSYVLARQIASGRWFDVFRARPARSNPSDDAPYALKMPRPQMVERAWAHALLQREAMLAAKISHPNLTPLLDASLDSDPAYLVYPFLEGPILADLVPRSCAVPQALWYLRQIAAALGALHDSGWLHGDVKPENVIISQQGHATLIDLGLARRLETAESRSDQLFAGDLAFAAPETLLPERELTAATDIYSLGATILALLAGPRPIGPPGPDAIAQLRSQRPDISREVAILLNSLTAHEPLRRPSAAELVERVARLEIESLMQW